MTDKDGVVKDNTIRKIMSLANEATKDMIDNNLIDAKNFKMADDIIAHALASLIVFLENDDLFEDEGGEE